MRGDKVTHSDGSLCPEVREGWGQGMLPNSRQHTPQDGGGLDQMAAWAGMYLIDLISPNYSIESEKQESSGTSSKGVAASCSQKNTEDARLYMSKKIPS